MQLMALNALLLFDAIFIFFLFLVSVSCLLYYLPLVPPPSRSSSRLVPTSEEEEEELEMELDVADLESALASRLDLDSETPHYCHHHYVRETREQQCQRQRQLSEQRHLDRQENDLERTEELELLEHHPTHPSSSSGGHYHQVADHDDHIIEENDPCPTPTNPSPHHLNRHHFVNGNSETHTKLDLNTLNVNITQPPPGQDHPATHIIMTPPQRKYYENSKRGERGQPFAPVETV